MARFIHPGKVEKVLGGIRVRRLLVPGLGVFEDELHDLVHQLLLLLGQVRIHRERKAVIRRHRLVGIDLRERHNLHILHRLGELRHASGVSDEHGNAPFRQIVGREGAGKRVDIAAVALTAGMTVEQMTALDLGYAPPFSPVWDPILVAARKATAAVRSGSA